jgi:DNA modification methylase
MLAINEIHCGDNCDLMAQMPRACVDVVVTSPPYDDLRTYGGHSWDFYGVAWQLSRVLKPGGVLVWIVADATKDGSETGTSMEQALHFKRLGLNLHDTMVWHKGGFSQAGDLSVRYGQSWEYCFVISAGKPKTWNPLKDRPNKWAGTGQHGTVRNADGSKKPVSNPGRKLAETGIRFNVWEIPPTKQDMGHPAPFPESLARDHIATWSNPGDLVLDPFCGSGTTARAALDLGRNFIGIEINPAYCDIAETRLLQSALAINE